MPFFSKVHFCFCFWSRKKLKEPIEAQPNENHKLKRGIALLIMPLVPTRSTPANCIGIVFWSYLFDGWRIGRCNWHRSSPCLLVSSELSTPIFPLIVNDDFWSGHIDFGPKMSPKIGKFGFPWISRRDRVGFPNCLDLHMHYCATVSASKFQV